MGRVESRCFGVRWGLGEVFPEPGVGGVDELFGGAVEDDFSLVEDEELCAVVDAVVGDLFDFAGLFVETAAGEEVGVLDAVGNDERGGLGDVALLDDEVDDGGGGDGVEAAGGGVVEDEVGIGDDGAGDGDATAHSSGELRGKFFDGVFELDEAEGLDDAGVSFFFGEFVFVEAVGDVVADGDGVEEGRLLKDHADAAAEFEEIFLAHGGDVVAEDLNGAGVGLEEAVDELQEDGFAAACGAEDDAGFAALDGEGDVLEDGLYIEGDGDVFDDNDGLLRVGFVLEGCGAGLGEVCHWSVILPLPAEDADHGACDEEVDDDDEDGGDDDSLSGGFTDALGTPLGVHAEVAADGGDDEAGEEGLGETLYDVSVLESTVGVVKIG